MNYDKLFDNDSGTKWHVLNFRTKGDVYVIWEMSEAVAITGYSFITDQGEYPVSWNLYGANGSSAPGYSSSSWSLISSVTDYEDTRDRDIYSTRTYSFSLSSEANEYKYYKWVITELQSEYSNLKVYEFTLEY